MNELYAVKKLMSSNILLLTQRKNRITLISMDLIQDVKKRLIARKGEWKEISKASKVSLSWIVKFVDGQIANPGYLTLLRLLNHLTKKDKK